MKKLKALNILVTTVALVLLLTSCGGDDNKVAAPGGTTAVSNTFTDGSHATAYNNAMALSCGNGGTRLPIRQYYTTETSYNAYNIAYSGSLTSGQLTGSATNLFLGISSDNDVLAVTKIASGSTVTGYNIAVSLCSYTYNGTPIISTSRSIDRVEVPSGINITSNTTCAYDFVATTFMNLYIGSYSIPQSGYVLPSFIFTIRFDPLYCR